MKATIVSDVITIFTISTDFTVTIVVTVIFYVVVKLFRHRPHRLVQRCFTINTACTRRRKRDKHRRRVETRPHVRPLCPSPPPSVLSIPSDPSVCPLLRPSCTSRPSRPPIPSVPSVHHVRPVRPVSHIHPARRVHQWLTPTWRRPWQSCTTNCSHRTRSIDLYRPPTPALSGPRSSGCGTDRRTGTQWLSRSTSFVA